MDTTEPADALPAEADLAVAWSPARVRAPLSTFLQLDHRLARIVARTTEPMLGQMRLAWWRDVLRQPPAERPFGDVVLDGIGRHWQGREAGLIALVDGWEILIGAERLGADEAASFASGRAAPFVSLVGKATVSACDRTGQAAKLWALADAAAGISDVGERRVFLDAARNIGTPRGRLPAEMRGLAVLEALARRALRNDGAPLMAGRGASLAALRAAIFLS
ncbi:MAG: hypothetical protein V2I74_10605 [Erythrobacter sp.]|jgi:phytoene synthase|nr:hypothetical protein [Erythrobacter sp.]